MADRRTLIYGISRDTIELARALAESGVPVDLVHPAAVATRLSSRLHELPEAVRVTAEWQPRDGLKYEAVFVDASFEEISPPDKLRPVVEAREADTPVRTIADYVFARSPGLTIGVTGSGGKTTTASLVAHILEVAGRRVHIARDWLTGVNRCPNYELVAALPDIAPDDVVVAELTSVYLSFTRTSPHIAVVTNLWPDHIEWHGSMASYTAAKQNILHRQTKGDWAILNGDDPLVREHFAPLCVGKTAYFGVEEPPHPYAVFIEGDRIRARWGEAAYEVASLRELEVEQPYVANALAAVAAALAVGVEPSRICSSLESFPGIPQRRELIGEAAGVRVYNDAMAGSPVKVQAGLQTFPDASVVLVAGGQATFPTEVLHSSREAQAQLESLAVVLERKTVSVVLFGEGGRVLRDLLQRKGYPERGVSEVADLHAAEELSASVARPGSVILFAPLYDVPRPHRRSFGHRALRLLSAREAASVETS